MNSKPNPEMVDDVNPEWTADTFARVKPASEVLGKLFSVPVATELLKPRGRPRAAVTRARLNMRIDPYVVDAMRKSGRGWQTQAHTVLAEAVAAGRFTAGRVAVAAA